MKHGARPGPFDWIQAAEPRAVAIVGICKNAGKTTLLNHLLSLRKKGVWGVFSTGIDGEERDSVFRVPKPAVKLEPDTIFCCDTANLDALGSGVKVLEKVRGSSAARPLWLARSLVPLQTEITGPGSVSEQISVLQAMREQGAEKVLIDGSLDRKSIALSEAVDAVAVVIGASFGSVSSVITEIRRLEFLNSLPEAKLGQQEFAKLLGSEQILLKKDGCWTGSDLHSLLGNEKELKKLLEQGHEAIYIPGALTDAVFPALREPLAALKANIIFRHPECLKLGLTRLERLVEELQPQVLIPFRIWSWTVNTASVGNVAVDAADFRARLREAFPQLDLPDIRELTS